MVKTNFSSTQQKPNNVHSLSTSRPTDTDSVPEDGHCIRKGRVLQRKNCYGEWPKAVKDKERPKAVKA